MNHRAALGCLVAVIVHGQVLGLQGVCDRVGVHLGYVVFGDGGKLDPIGSCDEPRPAVARPYPLGVKRRYNVPRLHLLDVVLRDT